MPKTSLSASAALFALASALLTLPDCGGVPVALQQPVSPLPAPPAEDAQEPATELAPAPEPAPPLRLTASDGKGLRLVALTGRAVIEGPLAFTELRLVFENPEDRVLEGTFSVTLPEGASISRFAMRIGDSLQEGEVIEQRRAREVYEDFLHRKQDPALLEKAAGNEFSARVFPIPARGRKELLLGYSQELPAPAAYVLPLRGLPAGGAIDVTVSVAGRSAPVAELRREGEAPEDLRVDPRLLGGPAGLRSGNLVVTRVQPVTNDAPDPLASAIVLVDTSASRALGLDAEVRLVGALAARIADEGGRGAPLSVACYDQTTELTFDGAASAFGAEARARIEARQALGASDLGRALGWAAAQAKARGVKRVVVISDGVATAGETAAGELRAAAARLKQAGVERLDAIAVGGIRDDALLRQLVTAGLARDGVVASGEGDVGATMRRLTRATRSGIPVAIEGARFVYPEVIDGAQAGDEVLVYADVPPEQTVRVSVGGAVIAPELARAERPLLERAFAQAKIARLLALEAKKGQDAALEREVVALSVAHRVLSPFTSLLVLETEQDYARFHIDPKALSDILTIEGGRVAVKNRRGSVPWKGQGQGAGEQVAKASEQKPDAAPERAVAAPAAPPPPEPQGDAFGAGQGFGGGHGRLGGAHATTPPMVRMGSTQVSGRLPPEVIQRIVRQNFGRFRHCYQQGLRRSATLAGRVVVRFTIDPTGAVSRVEDGGSDLPDAGVTACVASAFSGLSFPVPEGGTVTVVYPLAFSPEGSAAATPAPLALNPMAGRPLPPEEEPPTVAPYTGRFEVVMNALAAGRARDALGEARAFRKDAPGDVMALVALGEALEALGDKASAARAYGSIVDLFGARADMRRFAGERLERLGEAGLDLARDTFEKAAKSRPDHPASHRLLAFAWLKSGAPDKAFAAARAGLEQRYTGGRFAGAQQILQEDLGLIAAAWIRAEPALRADILAQLKAAGGALEDAPSLRFVLNWETDANDVDFHIQDDRGGHAYYADRFLPSGGALYADVTTGYGPECFTVRGPKENRAKRYAMKAHYYARGPMGYGMGKLEIIDHDGKGGLLFQERPFVVMADRAFVDLGAVER